MPRTDSLADLARSELPVGMNKICYIGICRFSICVTQNGLANSRFSPGPMLMRVQRLWLGAGNTVCVFEYEASGICDEAMTAASTTHSIDIRSVGNLGIVGLRTSDAGQFFDLIAY